MGRINKSTCEYFKKVDKLTEELKKEQKVYKDFCDSIDTTAILYELYKLLEVEDIIETKKRKNLPLTPEEHFFNMYFVKPSTIIKCFKKVGK